MNKLPHQIVSVLKYTGLATFCATEHNLHKKRKARMGLYTQKIPQVTVK